MSMVGGIKSHNIGQIQNLPNATQIFTPSSPIIDEFCFVKSPFSMIPI
jgi:hypothetical protein